ncbi:hypothetical protein UFOVP589_42 [uncultured Caudovirales phage]|uniref:Uncharacterized protein n=1 Tax=uncultured Caudovirales phage TaxID=2100421 RepID=A0A6J5MYD2_9CAUD|nr:hypothetical protein UFOVP589_42 [uncultured Caudovirales phage]
MRNNLIKRLRNPAFFTETSERNLMNEAADALEEVIKEFENLQFLFHATYNRHVSEIKELESKLGAKV